MGSLNDATLACFLQILKCRRLAEDINSNSPKHTIAKIIGRSENGPGSSRTGTFIGKLQRHHPPFRGCPVQMEHVLLLQYSSNPHLELPRTKKT